MNYQQNIGKIYLYPKDSFEERYRFLIYKQESTGCKYFNDL